MDQSWGQAEQALRDTLVHKSEGRAFRRIADAYGFAHPTSEASERAWRGALHQVALGPRGTFKTTFMAVEAALSDYNALVAVTVDASTPLVLTATPGTFTAAHVNRYVRTQGGLFWSEGPYPIGVGDVLYLAPRRTAYWDAPTWDLEPLTSRTTTVEILPFVWLERTPGEPLSLDTPENVGVPCLVEIVLLVDAIDQVPPSYLRLDETVAGNDDGMPWAGYLLENADLPGNPTGDGPLPVYLSDGTELPGVTQQIDLSLAAGCTALIGFAPYIG